MKHFFQTIKSWIEKSDAVVINAGAGMSVDSGLSDFWGKNGQWGQLEQKNESSVFELLNPQSFRQNAAFSWKHFAERMKAFENNEPHEGYKLLKKWIATYHLDYFVLTSNIDGHFQKAGFSEDKIREVHGNAFYFQSAKPELLDIVWKNKISAERLFSDIAGENYPVCPGTDIPARPNIYMFRDNTYNASRSKQQLVRYNDFLTRNKEKQILVFEIGSGPHVQSLRMKTRQLKTNLNANIVRINPVHYKIRLPGIGIAKGALEALKEIDSFLAK